jgi:hypothetical protein
MGRLIKTFIIAIFLVFTVFNVANATEECNSKREQCGHDDSDLQVEVNSNPSLTAEVTGGAATLNSTYTREREAPNIYLNAGQAERDCGKVIGLSGSNTTGGWALGIPLPRKWAPTCDFWRAANEAQENGHVWLSYHFQCQISHLKKAWGEDQCDEIEHNAWMELGIIQPEPTGMIFISEDEYDQLLIAQVSKEEIEEHQRQIEARFAQYDNLIEAQQQEIIVHREEAANNDEEFERLKQEAAALRDKQEAEEAKKASAYEQLIEARKQLKEEPNDLENSI